jgi:hypothetical protein
LQSKNLFAIYAQLKYNKGVAYAVVVERGETFGTKGHFGEDII